MTDIWNDQDVATLVQLVQTTKYQLIAEHLGRSVNAVCAKVKRMRDLREIPDTMAPRAKRLPKEPRAVVTAEAAKDNGAKTYDHAGFKAALKSLKEEADRLAGTLIKLEDVAEDGCHYVAGDPRESAECYCPGKALPGSDYCATHHPRVFKKIEAPPTPYVPVRRRREFMLEAA